jgi:hypothetical protein
MLVMKNNDLIGMAWILFFVALAIFLLAIGDPKASPDFSACPLCNK